jgi:excisionase family DNA binding protein
METYSVAEVASLLHVSRPTVYRLLLRRILRALPGLRTKRITATSVRSYVASASR